jgi:HlyD family secretion protein
MKFYQSAVLLCLGLCTACRTDPQASSPTIVVAAPAISVIALGRLEPDGEVIKLSVPNAQDSRVNQILVKEGEWVKAGQVIAILQGIDRRSVEVQDAEADVQLRQAELTKVEQGDAKRSQILAQQATIARLRAQMQAGSKQRRAAIASAEATLKEAQVSFDRRQKLVTEGAIAQSELDLARRNLETAQSALNERQAELEQTISTLEAEIVQEQAELAELGEVRSIDVSIAQAQLKKAQIAVQQRQANLEDVQVRAPVNGQILRINTRVGEQVNTTQGIVELARTNRMFVTAEVAEIDIAKVRQGQKATISSEYGGFSGEIQGTVERIDLQIGRRSLQDAGSSAVGSPTTDQNARIVAVKIRIDPKDSTKVSNLTYMQVRVKLDTNPATASTTN